MNIEKPQFIPDGYELIHWLGSGQTSHVWLSKHKRFGDVALKLPRPELHLRPVLRRMFENEVQITLSLHTGNLRDEHVVQGIEGFPTGPKAFLVLEYCPEGTLDELLLKEPQLPFKQACELVLDVAMGVEFAHKRKVLHRDVKPANVFMVANRRAKLGDFGTGQFMTERSEERVGTAFYMAPEIFEGQLPSIRSDIYSLGVLAYEVLAGRRPFTGESFDELMLQHLSSVPQGIRHLRSEVPLALSQAVSQAMSRDAKKRFASVRDFIEAFSSASDVLPIAEARHVNHVGRGTRAAPYVKPVETAKKPEQPSNKGWFSWFKRQKE